MRTLLQFALAGCFLARYSNATVYYVDTQGDNSNPGSASAPFATVSRGVGAAGPGDTVVVRDGLYGPENAVTAGDDPNAGNASPVVLKTSGTSDAWITIQADHKWGATLDCQMVCDAYFDLKNASYIVIQNFVITGGYREGIHSNDAANNIILRGNRIEFIANRSSSSRMGLDGLFTNPNCHDFVIDGNVFHDIGRTNAGQLDHGLYLHGSNFTVINNIFYNIGRGWSIQMADGLNNVVIANNTFAFANGNRGQIMMWNTQSNVVIQNNIFFQPAGYAIIRFRSSVSNCSIDHNLVFGPPAMMADSTGCTLDTTNQIGADPMLANGWLPPYDFHLLAGSPAIGAGISAPGVSSDSDGNPRPSGSAQDIGAYAFVPATP
jgi:Right handed beta helix region